MLENNIKQQVILILVQQLVQSVLLVLLETLLKGQFMFMEARFNMKIVEKDFNALTGEETISERNETVAEKKNREKLETEFAEMQAETETKATQRQAILDKLGLTSDEARLLLG